MRNDSMTYLVLEQLVAHGDEVRGRVQVLIIESV